jgi:hypothetical protein
VPWATTVTVSVVRSAERWLVDSASAGTSQWTADDARGGWAMSPAQGPLGVSVDDGVRGVWSIVPEQGPLRMW